jgi:hypothetical protein
MPVPRAVAHPTPNPDSLKFTAEASPADGASPLFITEGLAAYRNPREAAGDALGEALFKVPGVSSVLVLPSFVTVTKQPDSDWRHLGEIEAVLNAHLARGS